MRRREIDGNKLRAFRGKVSREDVAHKLRDRGHATDAKAVWRWENGHNQPNARVLLDYADVLGCRLEELYDEDDEEAAPAMAENLLEVLYTQLGQALGKQSVA